MNSYQLEQVRNKARADFAKSPALQAEFETPQNYEAYRVAKERGLIQCNERVETDPAKASFRRIWESMPEAQAQWRGGFEEAWRAHLAAESARCCPGLHTTGTIYGRAA